MSSTIPGNCMNTKYFCGSIELQCNVVFIGKFNLVICQHLSGEDKYKKNAVYYAPSISEIGKKS